MSIENTLWNSARPSSETFDPDKFEYLPESAQRYLSHSIAYGTPMASAVRLHMTGEIKLKAWLPFRATQTVLAKTGFIWKATVSLPAGFISGYDRFCEEQGEMHWRVLGIFPVMSAKGPDITRSAIGRMASEHMLLPSVLCQKDVLWTSSGASQATAVLEMKGVENRLSLTVGESGNLESISLPRWGNPDKGPFGLFPFGGIVEEESTFDGYTIPARLRLGWNYGTDKFSSGEFFRCQITHAEFR